MINNITISKYFIKLITYSLLSSGKFTISIFLIPLLTNCNDKNSRIPFS